jgi:Protein of unknown function (DUF3179)
MRALRYLLGVLILLVPEVLRVYYIMPFPGSQEDMASDLRQVNIAYWLHNNIWWLRLVGIALLLGPLWHYVKHGRGWKRVGALLPAVLCALVFFAFNFKFMADKMFLPLEQKALLPASENKGAENALAIVVARGGDAHAYPIELIGYHHQVLDTVGGAPVLVTYCTVCRTGRAWKPLVNGELETFRLVGMDHFNAMFEDSRTKSWWRQVTGDCIAGPLKGAQLEEVPSEQLVLSAFAERYPSGSVLQPDPRFAAEYAELKDYDEGAMVSSLEGRDTASWQPKSWVVGVVHNGMARAYDWAWLGSTSVAQDTLGGAHVEVRLDRTSGEFGAYVLDIDTVVSENLKSGEITQVVRWTDSIIPAYQEFWHSWRTFHPNTTRYIPTH